MQTRHSLTLRADARTLEAFLRQQLEVFNEPRATNEDGLGGGWTSVVVERRVEQPSLSERARACSRGPNLFWLAYPFVRAIDPGYLTARLQIVALMLPTDGRGGQASTRSGNEPLLLGQVDVLECEQTGEAHVSLRLLNLAGVVPEAYRLLDDLADALEETYGRSTLRDAQASEEAAPRGGRRRLRCWELPDWPDKLEAVRLYTDAQRQFGSGRQAANKVRSKIRSTFPGLLLERETFNSWRRDVKQWEEQGRPGPYGGALVR